MAPYSYDWIDNLGRQSPQQLTPGLEELQTGQTVMTMFELRDFAPGRCITVVSKQRQGARWLFGEVWVSYLIIPQNDRDCRLLAKLLVQFPRGPLGVLMRLVLPLGDLIMMRRQFLNLKRLAEDTASR